MKNDQVLSKQLIKILNESIEKLLPNDIKNINEFINHGECGLAYEILCIQLYEYDIQISQQFYERISSLGHSIGIQPLIWLPLEELIIEKNQQ